MKKSVLATLLVSLVMCAHAACPTWPTAERFTFNDAEVTDKRTGLVWARCSVGQTWSGSTCTGTARSLTQEQALQHAASQIGWRLPNVKELASLADKGCINPAIDSQAFPVTPGDAYWSSTPVVGKEYYVWYIYFINGGVSFGLDRSSSYYVRLVRVNQ